MLESDEVIVYLQIVFIGEMVLVFVAGMGLSVEILSDYFKI